MEADPKGSILLSDSYSLYASKYCKYSNEYSINSCNCWAHWSAPYTVFKVANIVLTKCISMEYGDKNIQPTLLHSAAS